MKNFKYLSVTSKDCSKLINSYFFQNLNQDDISKQALNMQIRLRQIDCNFSQESLLGKWYFSKDQNFSYCLLCDLKVSSQYVKKYLNQLKQRLYQDKIKNNNFNTEIKSIINKEVNDITSKYQEKLNMKDQKLQIIVIQENHISSQHINYSQQLEQVQVKSQFQAPMNSQKTIIDSKKNINSKQELSNEQIIQANKMTTKDKICIVGITIFVVLILIALAIVLPLTIKPGSDPCDPYRILCQGVSQQTKNYIFTNYKNPNDIQALLQAAQKLQSGNYQDILKSMVCLTYVMGNNAAQGFGNVRDLTLNTLQKMKTYLTAAAQSSSTTFLSSFSSAESCLFTVTTSMISSSQDNLNKRLLSDICGSSDLIYVDSIPGSPYRIASNINSIINLIQSDTGISQDSYQYRPLFMPQENFYINFISELNNTLAQAGFSLSQQQITNLVINLIDSTSSNILTIIPSLQQIINKTLLKFFQYMIPIILTNFASSVTTYSYQISTKINSGKVLVFIGHTSSSYLLDQEFILFSQINLSMPKLVFYLVSPSSSLAPSYSYISNPQDKVLKLFRTYASSLNVPSPIESNTLSSNFTGVGDLCLNNCLEGYINTFSNEILTQLKAQKQRACTPIVPNQF